MKKDTYLTVQSYRSGEDIAGIIVKSVAIGASIYGLCRNFKGLLSLTYFTDLSNIFMDLVLIGFLVRNIRNLCRGGKRMAPVSNGWYVLKFMATICITLTFFAYMVLLAPTNPAGFLGAYLGNGAGSLCLHFITPIFSIADFIFFDYYYVSSKAHIFFAIIPAYVYVGFVVVLARVFGVRWNGTMLAPYNFLNYGASTGWFGLDFSQFGRETLGIGVAYVIILLTCLFTGVGALYLRVKDVRKRKILGNY